MVTIIARAILEPISILMFCIKVEKFKEQGIRPYLILMNYQTTFDQFFVGMAFKGPIYYVATEDIFSNGFVSSLIRFLVAPIPIKKQTTDVAAVINCIKVAKEGGNIAIALYRIEGGYGVQPRWSDKNRKGKMRSYVFKVIEPEEYTKMSNEELFALIEPGIINTDFRYRWRYSSKHSEEKRGN